MMTDIWRVQNANSKRYSWYRCRLKLSASRIDFALISVGMIDQCINSGYTTGIKSDHLAFYVFFLIHSEPRGAGYWKLNTKHLYNHEYIKLMNNVIDEVKTSCSAMNLYKKMWEFLKFRAREESQTFSKNAASEINLIISQLSEKMDEMEQDLHACNHDILNNTKIELDELLDEKSKACIFCAKARFVDAGEKPTKYYLNLEKSRYAARMCNALYDEDNGNKLVTDSKAILGLQERFYSKLYKKDPQTSFECDNDTDIRLSEKMRDSLSSHFSIEEVQRAIKGLPNGKTCGNDGLPIEFFKLFWNKISEIYMGMLEEVYCDKLLHKTARIGVINMIPKQQKNTKFLRHLRPITLLQSDYKIIEKIIANRLEPAMEQIVNCDQRGFMKG